ncbi:DUF5916 domain-containing protein, partial [Klebsiella pneumoniae]|uniref:DUF5916 domain-containing protein n=1 Tax=Klebsiella pneumoniae TaxID=573 RepID=UPI0019539578
NRWNLAGKVSASELINYQVAGKTVFGYNHMIGFGKTGGRFNFQINQEFADDKYSSNDMGYFTNNNYMNHYMWIGYRWVKPTKWFNRLHYN